MHTVPEALEIVDAFLNAEWSKAERHQRRIDILDEVRRDPRPAARARRRRTEAMPEGHTLHRLARLHQRKFGRAPVIVSSPQGRFADGAAAVSGRVLKKASAWGKHLFHHYEGGRVVHVHLGLYGTFSEVALPMPLPVGQVRMRMVGTEFGTDLRGPTVCEVIDEAEVDDVIARLGPDPLRRDADGSLAWARITKSRRPIGALLMDQTVIAGVGNVYRSELLFRHRIDPYRPGVNVDARRVRRDVDRPGCADEGRGAPRQDHHGRPRGRPWSAVVPAGPPAHLRLPARRRTVSGVRDDGAHRGARGTQPVLVPELPEVRRSSR